MFRNLFNLFIKSIQNKNIEWCSVCLCVCLFICLSVCLLYVPWSSSQDVVFVLRHGVWWHPVELQASDGDYLVLGQVKELPKQNRQTSVQCFVRQCFGIEVFFGQQNLTVEKLLSLGLVTTFFQQKKEIHSVRRWMSSDQTSFTDSSTL